MINDWNYYVLNSVLGILSLCYLIINKCTSLINFFSSFQILSLTPYKNKSKYCYSWRDSNTAVLCHSYSTGGFCWEFTKKSIGSIRKTIAAAVVIRGTLVFCQ